MWRLIGLLVWFMALSDIGAGGGGAGDGSAGDGAGDGGDGSGGAGDGSGGDQSGGDGDSGAAGGDGDGDGGDGGDKPQFTQAEVDEMFQKRMATEKAKLEKELADRAEVEKLEGAEKAEAEAKLAREQAEATTAAAHTALIDTELRAQALAAKVKPERVEAFLRTLDRSGITVNEAMQVDQLMARGAVAKAVELMPEFVGSTKPPPPGGGDHDGEGDPTVWTKAKIAALSATEYEANREEIHRQMAAGTIK